MTLEAVDNYHLFGVANLPDISPGSDLAEIVVNGFEKYGGLERNDVLVVASKIVSKSENMYLSVKNIIPSDEAIELSLITNKPEKICQVVINESQSYRTNGKALIAVHKQGFELSSAGVDRLNDDLVILLPKDSDRSAENISKRIHELTGIQVSIIISDSHGRADRAGAGAVALGIYGLSPLRISSIVQTDGKIKYADETLCDMLAAGAAVIMGQRGRGVPVVCVRGLSYQFDREASIKSILHNPPND
jgi:coenzyme F420-0:L-glutamate ligase / coenzyme F420-1:gamma-L-glutamate ligase